MKPVAFDYARPTSLAHALQMLAATPDAKVLAGGQTLGPMLNLRLAQPALLVDISRIPELAAVSEDRRSVTVGATVTHAAIEDGRAGDPTGGFLRRVAAGIGYRAVRTRGTVGGSLANADPAADWLACLTGLDAHLTIAAASGRRRVPLAGFVVGAMQTALGEAELIAGIELRKFPPQARFGFAKICRRSGEFAEAIGVAVHDPDRETTRLVASTPTGAPVVAEAADLRADRDHLPGLPELRQRLLAAGFVGDDYAVRLSVVALRRALTDMVAHG